MRHLRGAPTWAGSALVTAGLLAIVLWRALPGPVPGRAVLVGAWLVGTVVVHVLLHNRWMRALDERCRAALAAGRSRARGPAHATHRVSGPLAGGVARRRDEASPEPVVIAPRSVPALPPLRPVGPVGSSRAGSRYHHTGRPARSRPRAGRAA